MGTQGPLLAKLQFSLAEFEEYGITWYHFSVNYVRCGLDDPFQGVITSTGLYDLPGAPDLSFSDFELVGFVYPDPDDDDPNVPNWARGQCQVAGDGVGANLFEACANSDPDRISNGIPVEYTVVFRFQSRDPITKAHFPITAQHFTEDGGLGARAHIQSYGDQKCSIKLDSRTGIFSYEDCVSVPEPGTMPLLGTGLVGILGMAGLHRRRNGHDVENG